MDKAARYPRSLIDKLGIKLEHKVHVLSIDDEPFWAQLTERAKDVSSGATPRKSLDVLLYGTKSIADLGKLEKLRAHIKSDGMIWVVWPKGKKELREDDVRNVALGIGLVDVKVLAFSETLSGLKLVIPVALRAQASKKKS